MPPSADPSKGSVDGTGRSHDAFATECPVCVYTDEGPILFACNTCDGSGELEVVPASVLRGAVEVLREIEAELKHPTRDGSWAESLDRIEAIVDRYSTRGGSDG